MSLINDVLKDLENKPKETDDSVLALMSCTAEQHTRKHKRWVVYIGLILLIISLMGAYFVYQHFFGVQAKLDRLSLKAPTPLAQSVSELPQEDAVEPATRAQTDLAVSKDNVTKAKPQPKPEPASFASENLPLEKSTEISAVKTDNIQAKKTRTEEIAPVQARSPVTHASASTNDQAEIKDNISMSQPEAEGVKQDSVQQAKSVGVPVSKSKTQEVSLYEGALAAFKKGQFTQSESLTDRLLRLNTKPDYLALKARLLLRRSPSELVLYLDQNNVDTAASDNLLALSASAYQRTQDHTRAVHSYDLLVQRQPLEGKWWLALAFSLEALGALEKAMKSYTVALQSGNLPANARAYAAKQATQIKVKLEALAKQAEEQE